MRLQQIMIPDIDETWNKVKQNPLSFQYALWEQFKNNVHQLYMEFSEPIVIFGSSSKTLKEKLNLVRKDNVYIHSMQADIYNSETNNMKYIYDLAIFSNSKMANKVIKDYVHMDEKHKNKILTYENKIVLFHSRIMSIAKSIEEYAYHSPLLYLLYSEKEIYDIQIIVNEFKDQSIEDINVRRLEQ